MNPTQLICANCNGDLPKVGGIEIRQHRADGKTAYYTCGAICAHGMILRIIDSEKQNPSADSQSRRSESG